MSKHTPGPWSVMLQNSRATEGGWPKTVTGWEVPVQVGEAANAGNTLCRVYMGGPGAIYSNKEVVEANARLIATAPDLYAIASEVCAIFDANHEGGDEYNGDLASDLWKNEIHAKLTAALAKVAA